MGALRVVLPPSLSAGVTLRLDLFANWETCCTALLLTWGSVEGAGFVGARVDSFRECSVSGSLRREGVLRKCDRNEADIAVVDGWKDPTSPGDIYGR